MQVVLDIEDRMVCPYRCIYSKCNYIDKDCYCPEGDGFPANCPLLSLCIAQTNDSIKFKE
jgi:hypothetical protein